MDPTITKSKTKNGIGEPVWEKEITVLRLEGKHYVEPGLFTEGIPATSALLAGFSVDVAAVFSSAHL